MPVDPNVINQIIEYLERFSIDMVRLSVADRLEALTSLVKMVEEEYNLSYEDARSIVTKWWQQKKEQFNA